MAGNSSILSVVAGLRRLICSAPIVAALGLAALATPPEATLNEWFPVMTEEKVDPAIAMLHGGKTVGFCCDTCLKKFLANPAKYEGRLPQFAQPSTAAAGGRNESRGHDHASDASGDNREPLLGRLHPMLAHFPLAGLPLALLGFIVRVAMDVRMRPVDCMRATRFDGLLGRQPGLWPGPFGLVTLNRHGLVRRC